VNATTTSHACPAPRVELADRLDAEPARDAVVERLADDLVAHLDAGLVHHDVVAHLIAFFASAPEPDVDEELLDIGHLGAVLGALSVDRLAPGVHHALELAVPVTTSTRRLNRLRGSNPPALLSQRKPLSSTCRT
jgi:hypothetical protein